MRKTTIFALWALGFGGAALADTSADKPPAKQGSPKGKAGDGCKADGDCDQGGRPMRCRDGKCQLLPVHPVT
jgi:hypothetical protein